VVQDAGGTPQPHTGPTPASAQQAEAPQESPEAALGSQLEDLESQHDIFMDPASCDPVRLAAVRSIAKSNPGQALINKKLTGWKTAKQKPTKNELICVVQERDKKQKPKNWHLDRLVEFLLDTEHPGERIVQPNEEVGVAPLPSGGLMYAVVEASQPKFATKKHYWSRKHLIRLTSSSVLRLVPYCMWQTQRSSRMSWGLFARTSQRLSPSTMPLARVKMQTQTSGLRTTLPASLGSSVLLVVLLAQT
jgi:hypothetical protein